MRKRPNVTACFFGEGAVAEGEFHESLNLAALWKLPVLFLCENNLYAMGTALALSESEIDLSRKAASYHLQAEVVDGMDVVAVEAAVQRLAGLVREGNGPAFLECRTYRFRAHSMFDAQLYRDKAEVEAWKARDPIARYVKWATSTGALHEAEIAEIENEVAREVEEAVAFAEAGSWEPAGDLARHVYAEGPTP
jgi:TPP-dependent pyruvate/acetoin dehydrogenase alpha subunit